MAVANAANAGRWAVKLAITTANGWTHAIKLVSER